MAIGFQRGRFGDHTRQDWSNSKPRPMVWTAWYPAQPLDDPTQSAPRPLRTKIFQEAARAERAPLKGQNLPLVVLSHGNAGAAEGMGWLAERLARQGYVVIGVDHHGNSATAPYQAEAFLAWWERARDLSVLIDYHLSQGPFAQKIDADRIYAAGFSLGGYSVLSALGAISDVARYRDWAQTQGFGWQSQEFPDPWDKFDQLYRDNKVFAASWARQGLDYSDSRIKAALLCAPATMVRAFEEQSLSQITRPIGIIVGGSDLQAPAEYAADWLAEKLPNVSLEYLPPKAAHYIFMNECTGFGRSHSAWLCQDADGVDRAAAHEAATALALRLFK